MYLGIDLGTTNIKAAVYDGELRLIDRRSRPVEYIRGNGFVEFDAEAYVRELMALLEDMLRERGVGDIRHMAFTGQAESLVVLDDGGRPLCRAISWMDERSGEECDILAGQFTPEEYEAVTGQQAILPTWPATKILWLRRNRPEIFSKAACYILLKDYVVYRLTGCMAADMSIATFTFYFDIYRKCYWDRMLSAIGIEESQLPPLVQPCSTVGRLLPEWQRQLGLRTAPGVSTGTLDHFAGMIGTGNIRPGQVTLSIGTVMAMAAMAQESAAGSTGVAMHYGFLPDTHVMLPVAESGGVSLEWFRKTCMGGVDYDTLNRVLEERSGTDILFLPYLVGTGAPEFDPRATGVFWGLRQEHDAFDMAYAVMEGVAFVLRKNCEEIAARGTPLSAVIATGGGAKSPLWCRLQANITGLPIRLPKEPEAACLGAAMIAATADGRYPDLSAAVEAVEFEREFLPEPSSGLEEKYRRFCALYRAALSIG